MFRVKRLERLRVLLVLFYCVCMVGVFMPSHLVTTISSMVVSMVAMMAIFVVSGRIEDEEVEAAALAKKYVERIKYYGSPVVRPGDAVTIPEDEIEVEIIYPD